MRWWKFLCHKIVASSKKRNQITLWTYHALWWSTMLSCFMFPIISLCLADKLSRGCLDFKRSISLACSSGKISRNVAHRSAKEAWNGRKLKLNCLTLFDFQPFRTCVESLDCQTLDSKKDTTVISKKASHCWNPFMRKASNVMSCSMLQPIPLLTIWITVEEQDTGLINMPMPPEWPPKDPKICWTERLRNCTRPWSHIRMQQMASRLLTISYCTLRISSASTMGI